VEAVLAKQKSLLPKVVNVTKASLNAIGYSDFLSWSSQPAHVYIGRNMNFYVKGALRSPWANPYTRKNTLEQNVFRNTKLTYANFA
jgi:hypothetical protein